MTDALFYHLQHRSLEDVLPTLLDRSIERGWRVVVQAGSPERVRALDDHLWSFRAGSFLPHVTARDRDAVRTPIVIADDDSNPNDATVRFLVDGACLPSEGLADYARWVLIFDGADPDRVAEVRADWSRAKSAGIETTYWQLSETGRWERKG